MVKATRWWWVSALTVSVMLFVLAGSNPAQDKKPIEKHDSAALYNSLRDVINTGAKMYNEQNDHAGCYRLFQGSLLSVRPFLAPDLQKKIDTGMASAEKLPNFAERAFELRRVIDDVRSQVKQGEPKVEEKKKDQKKIDEKKKDEKKVEEKKVEEKKKDEKKIDEKKKDEKKVEEKKKDEKKIDEKKKDETKVEEKKKDEKKIDEKKSAETTSDKGQVAGKLTFDGKAIAGGYFVTLIGADGKKFSSALQKDGLFQFKTPIPKGEYRVAIEAIPGEAAKVSALPSRYSAEATSGLTVRVKGGKQQVDLNLVK
jgi:hypothetical protein